MMPILGLQTSPLHLVFYFLFEHFVLFLLCTKCVNQARRRGGSKGWNEPPLKFDNGGLKYK